MPGAVFWAGGKMSKMHNKTAYIQNAKQAGKMCAGLFCVILHRKHRGMLCGMHKKAEDLEGNFGKMRVE